MKMNHFPYFGADRQELLEHLVAELKDISTDPTCVAHTDFDCYKSSSCDTNYSVAGWMAFRSHILVPEVDCPIDNDTDDDEFARIFTNLEPEYPPSVMHKLLGDSWGRIFGAKHTVVSLLGGGTGGYAERIEVAEDLLQEELDG